jgi:hypothetical protein
MNQEITSINLRDFMDEPEGWGRAQGRKVYQRLLDFVEEHPLVTVFRVSMQGVRRVDMSFASETLIELARRYRGTKGFCLVDLHDADVIENWDAAADRKRQPLVLWMNDGAKVIGAQPSRGTREALQFALERPQVRAAEFVDAAPDMSIANASSKFKLLWEQGFVLRQENVADSGGVEFVYMRIG